MSRALTTRSAIFTVAQFLQMGIGFFLIPVYTAYLSTADYGILSIATALAGLLTILYLQPIEGVFTRFHYDFDDERRRREFFGSVWLFLLAYVAVATVVLEAIGRSGVLSRIAISYEPYGRYVVYTTLIAAVAFLLPRAIFLVREKPWHYAGLNFGLFVLSMSAVTWFVAFKREGAAGSLKGTFLATLIVAIPALVVVVRNIRPTFRLDDVKAAVAFALPILPHLLSLWALDLADRLILRRYVPLSDIGIYTLGYQIGSIPQIVAFAISSAIAPFYYATAGSHPDARSILSRVTTYYLMTLAWIAAGTVMLGRDIIAIAARPEYTDAYRVVPWVALGSFCRGFYFMFVSALYYTKRLKALPFISVAAAASNIALNLILVPRFGYLAAAITTLVTFALQAAMMYVAAQRSYPIAYEWPRLGVIVAAGIVTAMAAGLFVLPNILHDFVLKAFLALLFPLMLFALRIVPIPDGLRR